MGALLLFFRCEFGVCTMEAEDLVLWQKVLEEVTVRGDVRYPERYVEKLRSEGVRPQEVLGRLQRRKAKLEKIEREEEESLRARYAETFRRLEEPREERWRELYRATCARDDVENPERFVADLRRRYYDPGEVEDLEWNPYRPVSWEEIREELAVPEWLEKILAGRGGEEPFSEGCDWWL